MEYARWPKGGVTLYGYGSVLPAPGCTWHRANAAYVRSEKYQEKHARNIWLAEVASQCMDVVMHYGGNVAWEWPRGNDMWQSETGAHLMKRDGCVEAVFDGCSFATSDKEGKLIRKPWRVITNCMQLWRELHGRTCSHNHEHGQCRGNTATASGGYSDGFADCVMSVVRQVRDGEKNKLSLLGDDQLAFQVHDAISAELEEWLGETTVPKAHTRYNLQQNGVVSRSVLLGAYCRRGLGVTNATSKGKWSRALELIHELARRREGERCNKRYLSIQVNSYDSGTCVPRHRDKYNEGLSDIYVCGQFEGGELYCGGERVDAIGKWGVLNGKEWHWTEPHRGRRLSIVLYTPKGWEKLSKDHLEALAGFGFPVQGTQRALQCSLDAEVQEEPCWCMDRYCPECSKCFLGVSMPKSHPDEVVSESCMSLPGYEEEVKNDICGEINKCDGVERRVGIDHVAEDEDGTQHEEVQMHREKEPSHDPPLWGLVTRQIHQGDPEFHSKECQAALREEHEKLLKRGVWDTSTVCELRDLYGDRSQEDFLIGQVFAIMGEKFAEEGAQQRQYKARIVFAGDRVKTK
eukprot:793344-Amphidinium_carterae.2